MVKAGTATFDDNYPVDQFKNLGFGIEYPITQAEYPKIWVDYEPETLSKISPNPYYYTDPVNNLQQKYIGWKFTGEATFTIVALSSRERDGIFDEMVRVIAFGGQDADRSVFRQAIDSNIYVATMFNWDSIRQFGKGESQGTPWGSDEVIYEQTLGISLFGEFFSDPSQREFATLRDVKYGATVETG